MNRETKEELSLKLVLSEVAIQDMKCQRLNFLSFYKWGRGQSSPSPSHLPTDSLFRRNAAVSIISFSNIPAAKSQMKTTNGAAEIND